MSRNLTASGVFTNNAEGPAVDQFGVLHATGYGVRVKVYFIYFSKSRSSQFKRFLTFHLNVISSSKV